MIILPFLQLLLLMATAVKSMHLLEAEECSSANSTTHCESCISSGPGCAWCKDKYFEDPKCGTKKSLLEKGCSQKDIVDPDNVGTVIEDSANLKPQRIKLELRPGKPHTFQVQAKLRDQQRPVDLYFFTSFYASNKGKDDRVKALESSLIQDIIERDPNMDVKTIGYGLFGNTFITDKRRKECEDTGEACERELYFAHSQSTSKSHYGSHQHAEAGLQALMQVAVCKDVINWGAERERVVIYTPEWWYKLAPEGETVDTEAVNGRLCQLNSSSLQTQMRPPSLSELRKALLENNIKVIFVIPFAWLKEYVELSYKLPMARLAVVDIMGPTYPSLGSAFQILRDTLVLAHLPVPGLNVTYQPDCSRYTINNLQVDCHLRAKHRKKTQTFNVTVTSESCVLPATMAIEHVNAQEKLIAELTPLCSCECEDKPDPELCSHAGNPVCGKCRCDAGYYGPSCECSLHGDDDQACKEREGALVCSGRGNCVCGFCDCNKVPPHQIYGRYCECDNYSCPKYQGQICGGNGRCVCGRCLCQEDHIGEACECSTELNKCQSADGQICSGRGNCDCNRCLCEPMYSGALCEECPTCSGHT